MNICIPNERRPFEHRVGLPPAGAEMFVKHGHTVYVENGAGEGAGFSDEEYIQSGAKIVYSQEEAFGRGDLVLKFTRPLREELEMMRRGQAVAGFLHLAAARQDKIDLLLSKAITTIAYEQVQEDSGYRPVLTPLSQIGGRMVVQIAARLLQNDHGGRGILLGGVTGVPSAEVVIIGAGVVGTTAARTFAGVGAHVSVLDIDLLCLQKLQALMSHPLVTMLSTPYNVRRATSFADVVIGAVLAPGERAPIVVTRDMVTSMKPRAVIIDVSIDQGGCVETSRPTNHGSPTFVEEGVTHYCVPNMSGVLGRTASNALFYGAYPYLEAIARDGLEETIENNPALGLGINTRDGNAVHLRRPGGIERGEA
ncbi:MAG: alanine dehydrogenase [Anaerolineales bacterium]|nr:alanine dehydrogenase [Anaerolineales bacterium]